MTKMQFIKALFSDKILLRIVFEDLFDIKRKVRSNKFHLDSTMKWLTSAQDNSATGGIPRGWSCFTLHLNYGRGVKIERKH